MALVAILGVSGGGDGVSCGAGIMVIEKAAITRADSKGESRQ
jgi:hypothetical protein